MSAYTAGPPKKTIGIDTHLASPYGPDRPESCCALLQLLHAVAPARTSADHNSVCPLLPVDIVLVILALLQAIPSVLCVPSLCQVWENSNEKNKKIVFFVSLQHTVVRFLPLPEFATCQQ